MFVWLCSSVVCELVYYELIFYMTTYFHWALDKTALDLV